MVSARTGALRFGPRAGDGGLEPGIELCMDDVQPVGAAILRFGIRGLTGMLEGAGVGFGHASKLHLELFVHPRPKPVDQVVEVGKVLLGHSPPLSGPGGASQGRRTPQIQPQQQLDASP